MQKRIVYILLLMTCSVVLIVGLQFYWNYNNYKVSVVNFKKESNNALLNAVKIQQQLRRDEVSNKIKHLMADTSFLNITCNIDNRDSATVFVINDTHPKFLEDTARKVRLYKAGITDFTQKLKTITPEAKQHFINHFIKNTLNRDLKEGLVYYYTQGLGDSISAALSNSKLNATQLNKLYKKELKSKGIYTNARVALNNLKASTSSHHTSKVNASLVGYGKQDIVYGILENPNRYYLREMRWILLSSMLLIFIVIICFYYTVRTLLNQQKLSLLKNQFVSNMTHEIHTPLASIKITTEALQKFDFDNETKSEYLTIIQNQTDKLIDLTNQLLIKARTENFDIDDFTTFELDKLIKNVIDNKLIERNNQINYKETKLRIKGNEVHLSNVISNLIDNALKYNTSTLKLITIEVTLHQKAIKINITDNGKGIAKKDLKFIFDPFYRVTKNEIHDVKGYGLGLNYSKTVVEKHGGTINVMSEINKGSTFIINLPYER